MSKYIVRPIQDASCSLDQRVEVRSRMRTAQRTEGVALDSRQRHQWMARRARRAVEVGMGPGLPAQAPTEDQTQRAHDEAPGKPCRTFRSAADRVLTLNGPDWLAEQVVGSLRAALERLRDDPHEGDRRIDRVAERRLAAARVPSIEALRHEPQTDDSVVATIERE